MYLRNYKFKTKWFYINSKKKFFRFIFNFNLSFIKIYEYKMKHLFLVAIVSFFLSLNSVSGCKTDLECNHGICSSSISRCVCKHSYIDFKNTTCIYKQKSKLVTFLLSLVLGPFGADWFYLSNGSKNYILIGLAKLAISFSMFIILCFALCCAGCAECFENANKEKMEKCFGIFAGAFFVFLPPLCAAAAGIWYFVDWIRVLCDNFPDGNNVPLLEW